MKNKLYFVIILTIIVGITSACKKSTPYTYVETESEIWDRIGEEQIDTSDNTYYQGQDGDEEIDTAEWLESWGIYETDERIEEDRSKELNVGNLSKSDLNGSWEIDAQRGVLDGEVITIDIAVRLMYTLNDIEYKDKKSRIEIINADIDGKPILDIKYSTQKESAEKVESSIKITGEHVKTGSKLTLAYRVYNGDMGAPMGDIFEESITLR